MVKSASVFHFTKSTIVSTPRCNYIEIKRLSLHNKLMQYPLLKLNVFLPFTVKTEVVIVLCSIRVISHIVNYV